MRKLSLAELDVEAVSFDAAVAATPAIDRFCSSSDWVVPAALALMPPREPWIWCSGHGAGWAACMLSRQPRARVIEPLELAWGLASPLVGADPAALVAELGAEHLRRRDEWDYLVLAGLVRDGEAFRAVVREFGRWCQVRGGQPTVRHVASLDGGVDGFLGRRSRNLRKGLQRSMRAAAAAGVGFEAVRVSDTAGADALYERILAVERRSWKGREGMGIDQGPMREFYRHMIRRLALRGGQRTVFGKLGERDVSYVFGGVFGDTYRGLQFSYDAELERLGLGSVGQYHQIVQLCGEGVARYDLGTDMDYKRRWAEEQLETWLMVVEQV